MFSGEMREVLLDVLTSWYVLGATAILLLYLALVRRVASARRSPAFISRSRPKRAKKAAATMAVAAPDESEDKEDSNRALGLEDD